jgi:hypothetical protein
VRGQGTRSAAALAALVLVAGALGACGGSDSSTSGSTAGGPGSDASQANEKAGQGSEAGSGGESGGRGDGASNETPAKVETAPLKVTGGGSAQYRVRGGDNSVQEYGEESDESELEEAATALHDYLVARAEEEWGTACANLAQNVKDQLRSLASRSEKLKGKGCAETLAALTPRLPASVRRETTVVEAGSLRVEGEQAFLIYSGAKGETYTVLMVAEDGAWKVGSLGATPLS